MINTTLSGRGVKIHRYESVSVFNVKDATSSIRGPLYGFMVPLNGRWPDSKVTYRLTEALLLILQSVSQLL